MELRPLAPVLYPQGWQGPRASKLDPFKSYLDQGGGPSDHLGHQCFTNWGRPVRSAR
jgi:hypothetical protein